MVGCKVWPEAWDVGLDTLDIPFHIVMLIKSHGMQLFSQILFPSRALEVGTFTSSKQFKSNTCILHL